MKIERRDGRFPIKAGIHVARELAMIAGWITITAMGLVWLNAPVPSKGDIWLSASEKALMYLGPHGLASVGAGMAVASCAIAVVLVFRIQIRGISLMAKWRCFGAAVPLHALCLGVVNSAKPATEGYFILLWAELLLAHALILPLAFIGALLYERLLRSAKALA